MVPETLRHREWNEEQWKNAFKSLLGVTVEADKKLDDLIAGGWALGRRRSRLIARDFIIPVDVTHGLTIFCFIWLKPPVLPDNYQYLTQHRWNLFSGASDDPMPESRFEVVPDWLLQIDSHQLHAILQNIPIRTIMRLD